MMAEEPRDTARDRATPLLFEHERLGGRFGRFGDALVALDYGIPVDEPLPLDHPLVTDLSFQGSLRVSGPGSHAFLSALLTADIAALDHIGATAWSLILNGEGQILDIVLAMRTGDDEYLLMTDAPVSAEVLEWLGTFRRLRRDGTVGRGDGTGEEDFLFPGVLLEDQSGSLGLVCLMGPGASEMLDELAGGGRTVSRGLAESGGLHLSDAIPGMPFMAIRDGAVEQSLLVFASRLAIVRLWQALLGFPELQAVGFDQYTAVRRACGLWLEGVDEGAYRTPAEAGLAGLLRPEGGFVGFRAVERG